MRGTSYDRILKLENWLLLFVMFSGDMCGVVLHIEMVIWNTFGDHLLASDWTAELTQDKIAQGSIPHLDQGMPICCTFRILAVPLLVL